MTTLRTPQLIVLLGNLRAAGPDGCGLEWLAARVNMGRLDLERALGRQIQLGLVEEQGGVYRMKAGSPCQGGRA